MCDNCKNYEAAVTSARDQFVAAMRDKGITPEESAFAAFALRNAAEGLVLAEPDPARHVPVGAVVASLREIATDYDDAAKRLA